MRSGVLAIEGRLLITELVVAFSDFARTPEL